MSYGNQLNILRAKSNQYGPDWHAIVCCKNKGELEMAAEDAALQLGGKYSNVGQSLVLANGSRVIFRIVTCVMEAQRAFYGREFTQIVWLHKPDAPELIDMARSRLRSRKVPADDWRYEYCMVR